MLLKCTRKARKPPQRITQTFRYSTRCHQISQNVQVQDMVKIHHLLVQARGEGDRSIAAGGSQEYSRDLKILPGGKRDKLVQEYNIEFHEATKKVVNRRYSLSGIVSLPRNTQNTVPEKLIHPRPGLHQIQNLST